MRAILSGNAGQRAQTRGQIAKGEKTDSVELIRLRFHLNGSLVSVQNGVISPSRCTVTRSNVAKK
ncbi:hypothetical protein [Tardiphaga sp. 813_E8_N1_3]|uniref:hypothetical protein n=1 Tax=Tardiphaga sp. 813_E8_N1_3 TaxID=3240760 RepID=UPI003F271C00